MYHRLTPERLDPFPQSARFMQDKLVTLRLKGQREVVFVGEFEVK